MGMRKEWHGKSLGTRWKAEKPCMGMRHCAVYDTWSVYHIGTLIMRLILHQNTLKPQTDNFLMQLYRQHGNYSSKAHTVR